MENKYNQLDLLANPAYGMVAAAALARRAAGQASSAATLLSAPAEPGPGWHVGCTTSPTPKPTAGGPRPPRSLSPYTGCAAAPWVALGARPALRGAAHGVVPAGFFLSWVSRLRFGRPRRDGRLAAKREREQSVGVCAGAGPRAGAAGAEGAFRSTTRVVRVGAKTSLPEEQRSVGHGKSAVAAVRMRRSPKNASCRGETLGGAKRV